MHLAEIIGARVLGPAGEEIGHVSDVHLIEAAAPGRAATTMRIDGLVVATCRRGRLLAYDHRPAQAPWPLVVLARRAASHALWASWDLVARHERPPAVGEPGTVALTRSASALRPLNEVHHEWADHDD